MKAVYGYTYTKDAKGNLVALDMTAPTLDAAATYDATAILAADGTYVLYIDMTSADKFGTGVGDDLSKTETLKAWDYDANIKDEAKLNVTVEADTNWKYVNNQKVLTDATATTLTLSFDTIYDALENYHADIAAGGYLFGMASDHGLSLFGDHNSYAKVWSAAADNATDKDVEVYLDVTDMTMATYGNCCEMVKSVTLKLPAVKLEAGDVIGIEFAIDGETIEVEGFADGNDISGVVYVKFNGTALEVIKGELTADLNCCFPVHSDLGIVESLIG